MGNSEQIAVRISPELKKLLDADERYNYEIVEAALWREFGGQRDAAIERKIEYKEQQASVIRNSMNELQEDLDDVMDDLEPLRQAYDERHSRLQDVLDEADDILKPSMLTLDNPAVQKFADKADLTPEQLLKRIRQRRVSSDGE